MARPPRIRITKRDRDEFKRLARNTKAKIRRTSENYGIDLSGEVNIPDSIEEFSTRKEFNKWKQRQKSFTNRYNLDYQFVKNPHGVVASKSEIRRIERATKRAQINARRKRREIEAQMSEEMKQQRGMLQRPDLQGFSVPKDFDFKTVKDRWRLEDIERNMERRADDTYYDKAMKTMQDNFIRSVEGTLGSLGADGENVIERLKGLSPESFYDLYLQYNEVFSFELWDSQGQMIPSYEEVQGHLSKMDSVVQRYEDGKVDTDLKKF